MKRLKLDIQKFGGGDAENIDFPSSGSMAGHIHWDSTVYGSTPAEKASLNKSKVVAKIYVLRTDGSWTQGNFTGNLNINGSISYFDTNKYVSNSWVLLLEKEIDVSHNPDGTKTIWIGGQINGPTGTSWAGVSVSGGANKSLDTIPRYFTQIPKVEYQSATTTSASFKWTTSENASSVKYILDGGSETSCFSGDAKTGTFSISGLTAKTSHTLKIKAQRKDSGLWSDGNTITFSTSNKTVRIRVNGAWKDATPYVRVNNQWKVAVPYTRVNGQWKKGK